MNWLISSVSKQNSLGNGGFGIGGPISDYYEVMERYQAAEHKNNPLKKEYTYLDEMIEKLCGSSKCIDIGHDSTIFYALILRSDFLQLKTELLDLFYSRLCLKFIQRQIFDDIVENLQKLEMVPHLKKYLVKGLLDSCQLSLIVKNDASSQGERNTVTWDCVNLSGNENLKISKNVFKTTNVTLRTARCLKIVMMLCEFKGLILNGCELNEKNSIIFVEGLNIERLSLARCGPYVNDIIQENPQGILDSLTHLDISNNQVTNASLERIRWLPLKSLKMLNCISNDLDIGILWEDGVLKDNIQALDLS